MFARIYQYIKARKWRFIIGTPIALLLLIVIVMATRPAQPEYVLAVAERDDLRQTVEAVGTVISERELQLQFPSSGIVSQVLVKEGDTVTAGQRLAALRAGNLAADISSAAARLRSAEADLQAKEEGARPEDIAIAEAEVLNRKSSLDAAKATLKNAEDAVSTSETKLAALRAELDTSLSGIVAAVPSTIQKQTTTVLNALAAVEDVFKNNDVQDAIYKFNSHDSADVQIGLTTAQNDLRTLFSGVTAVDVESALSMLNRTKAECNDAVATVNKAFDLVSRLPETVYFTNADRETHKTAIAAERSAIQTAIVAIDTAINDVRDASANITTRIASEEASLTSAKGTRDRATADIATYESSLRIAEAQLALKKAPVRETDLAVAVASVQQARAALARAQADYGNTIITAPVAGVITKVDLKPGEFAPTPAISMLGDSPYQIEMFVSEVDIPKVQLTQTGSVELDAFPGVNFALRVSQIDAAPTDRDGVSKYRVRLDYVYPHDELKLGMTGDAVIVTGFSGNVVQVPIRSVLEREDGTEYVRVMKDDGTIEERTVQSGMEGEGSTIEVTGVDEGETVVVLIKE